MKECQSRVLSFGIGESEQKGEKWRENDMTDRDFCCII